MRMMCTRNVNKKRVPVRLGLCPSRADLQGRKRKEDVEVEQLSITFQRDQQLKLHKDSHDSLQQSPDVLSDEAASDNMQMFAVIVVINDYLCAEPLHGATGDAKKIAEFLKISLQVPKENMIVLLDGDATRDEILKFLHTHLRDNDRIHRGDAIIIYFAGHGTIYETHVREPMEAIMPVDSGLELPDGTHVVDISDRQINLFLKELYDAKGENITVITDCYYSAGSTRDRSSPRNLTARSRPSLQLTHQDLIDAAEADQWKQWSPKSATDSLYQPCKESHMLLAACRSNEKAFENEKGGAFTRLLLQILLSRSLHSLTYEMLEDCMTHPSITYYQHPVVLGEHKASRIFRIGHPLDRHRSRAIDALSEVGEMRSGHACAPHVCGVAEVHRLVSVGGWHIMQGEARREPQRV